jgi:predicted DNA-binding transcriptional regulator AlpA
VTVYLRFSDLVARGILKNRATLGNWIKDHGFPPGKLIGPNTRVWTEAEVDAYLASRPTDPKPTSLTRDHRGRGGKAARKQKAAARRRALSSPDR